MHLTRDIDRIAAAQHGLVTLHQAEMAGLGPDQIRWLTRSRRWASLRPGVYVAASSPRTRMQLIVATALSLAPGAWVSHATAGELWGFPDVQGDALEVVIGPNRRIRMAGVQGHRSSRLFTADLTSYHRVPVTTPERTLVDLSARFTPAVLGRVLDDGLRRRVIRLERLRGCAGRLTEAPGRRPSVVQSLLADRLPGYHPGDSDIETRILGVIVGGGLPVPVQQCRAQLDGRTARIDLAYPEARLAIELDGWEHHRTRTAFDHDRARANALVAAGWTVIRFTSRSSDSEIIGCLRAALRRFGTSGAA